MRFCSKIFEILQNRVCMLQFSCRFASLSPFRLSNRTPKITQILKIMRHTTVNTVPFSKEEKILIKSLYECQGYNAQQFITRVSG